VNRPTCSVEGCPRAVVFGVGGRLYCLAHDPDRPKGADTRVVVGATE
jgi:hypothetical protein